MTGIWKKFVENLSSEWVLTETGLSNGGSAILARSLITSFIIFTVVLLSINLLDPERVYKFSSYELRIQAIDKISWYGIIFAAVYTGLYARFAAQWSYIAALYNQIKQAECSMHNADVMAEWKAGFIEDVENLHLANKESVAPIVNAWASEELVREKYIAHTPGGQKRFDLLIQRVESCIKYVKDKYPDA